MKLCCLPCFAFDEALNIVFTSGYPAGCSHHCCVVSIENMLDNGVRKVIAVWLMLCALDNGLQIPIIAVWLVSDRDTRQ